ncbi:MAG: hypothetical protein INR71_11105 [Terriglobus roseus]|nr:hypothetical protein [Terriglobus roseus]
MPARSPQQVGGYDCGVFVCFNAFCVARGLDPADAFGADDMPDARRQVAATLLNGGFRGDFDYLAPRGE